jgi:hypothetical protein
MRGTMISISRLSLLAALLAFAGLASRAEDTKEGVAVLKRVKGNVLVSQESGLASGDEARRLPAGTRVITTANAEATVAYDDGCEVALKPNQRFEVQVGKPCKELIAQAASILAEPAGMAVAGAAGGFVGFAATLPAVGGGVVGVAIIQALRQNQSVSPN